MSRILIIATVVLVVSLLPAASLLAGDSKDDKKGTTTEDVGRGLKSAGKNVENEIPKIGPAIGDTFNKLTGKHKQSDQNSSKKNK